MRRKEDLNNFEMLYIIYCSTMLRYLIDPICSAVSIYIVNNPLESPFLLGFVYFWIYFITRIPMMFIYHDVE